MGRIWAENNSERLSRMEVDGGNSNDISYGATFSFVCD
jgi:hypothetical protein